MKVKDKTYVKRKGKWVLVPRAIVRWQNKKARNIANWSLDSLLDARNRPKFRK